MSGQSLPKEGFKTVALISLVIGLLFLAIPALYFLLKSMSNLIIKSIIPISNIVDTVGSAILSIIGNNPLFFGAFLFIVTAILFGVGYSIKDDYDREFYQLLIYLSWFIIPLVTFLSVLVSTSESVIVGFWFLIYVSPPIIFGILKGLQFLLSTFSR